MEWWEQDEYQIAEIENDFDRGITYLMAHLTEQGLWEYAIVQWRYGSAYLMLQFSSGLVTLNQL